jgi:ribonuclease HI
MSIFYVDGSCSGNGKSENIGGFGVVKLDDNGKYLYSYAKRNKNTTNNREELRAILRVMLIARIEQQFSDNSPPIVYSDSAYCVNTFTDWMFRWADNNWVKSDGKVPENLDLIKTYYECYLSGYRIDLRKIKGHAGEQWNELADALATGKISPMEADKKYANDTMYEM